MSAETNIICLWSVLNKMLSPKTCCYTTYSAVGSFAIYNKIYFKVYLMSIQKGPLPIYWRIEDDC